LFEEKILKDKKTIVSKFEGQFVENVREGYATKTVYVSGKVDWEYRGMWAADMPTGEGTLKTLVQVEERAEALEAKLELERLQAAM
jgi:hypothetical protein